MTRTPSPSTRTRVLVVKLSSLGDLFHALPAVHGIKTGLDADIDWVTQPEYVDLVRCFEDVDGVIPFPRHGFLRGLPSFIRALRARRYDQAVDLQGLFKSALVTRLARAPRRLGPSCHREGSRLLYHRPAPSRGAGRHAVDVARDVLPALGLPDVEPVFPVRFPPAPRREPSPRVALVPRSRWPTKNWPAPRFMEVAQVLAADHGVSVFLVGSPADRAVCAAIAAEAGPGVVDLAGRTSLVDTGSLLQAMDLVICNDTGPMHMAAALGVPVLALFGPTDAARTGPYGDRHRVLTAEADCRPCYRRDCRVGSRRCLRAIPVDRVVSAARDMLG